MLFFIYNNLLRHSGSRPDSFSPQINCVGFAHTQANNNTIKDNAKDNLDADAAAVGTRCRSDKHKTKRGRKFR